MAYPQDRRYTKSHEWVLMDGDIATIGITQYAQEQLGDVVFVELPAVGAAVTRDGAMGNIESVKAVSEVFAPVAGEVVEVNAALEARPELLNSDPHGDGWLVRVRVAPGSDGGLMTAAEYEAFLAEEGAH
jgi:glycine cleavage system H protein